MDSMICGDTTLLAYPDYLPDYIQRGTVLWSQETYRLLYMPDPSIAPVAEYAKYDGWDGWCDDFWMPPTEAQQDRGMTRNQPSPWIPASSAERRYSRLSLLVHDIMVCKYKDLSQETKDKTLFELQHLNKKHSQEKWGGPMPSGDVPIWLVGFTILS